jgi:tetratricopeptide (TPR) repeat protein
MSRAHRNPTPFTRTSAQTRFGTAYETGVRCLQEKRFTSAIGLLNDALEAQPADVAALSNLALALIAVGRLDEALASYDRALVEMPDFAVLHFSRANVLQTQARWTEALVAYDKALAKRAHFPEALTNRGNTLRQMGRTAEAMASYEQALSLSPRFAEALFSIATLLDQTGRQPEALAALDRFLSVDKTSVQGYLTRADLHKRLENPEAACADFTQAVRADPRHAIAHTLLGDQLAELGRSEDARKSYQRATEIEPGFADAHDRLGCALVQLGRFDEARRAHEKAVALEPGKPGFYFNLCDVTKFDVADPRFHAMTQMAADSHSLAAQDEILLRFALFKAYSDQGDFKAAFHQLTRGNGLKRAQIEYDERALHSDMKNVRALFNARLLAQHRGHGHASKTPIFVVGLPRSGSTLTEQILATHPKVHGAGEVADFVAASVEVAGDTLRDLRVGDDTPDALREQLRRIGANYVDRIQARCGKAERVVNKMLENFRFVGLIHLALPDAKIIHIRRDPVDTCFSCYSKLFTSNIPYAYDLGELGRYYRSYDRLMQHWRATIPAETLLQIRYEDLVADPAAIGRQMIEHCGLEWDERCLDFHRNPRPVRTASAVQVRNPIYTNAIGTSAKFGDQLAPLIEALGPSVENRFSPAFTLKSLWSRFRGNGDYVSKARMGA